MRLMARYFLLVVCVGLIGCGNERVSLVDRRNYKNLLQRLEIGYAYDNRAVTSQVVLGDLRAYLEKRRDKIYDGDEERYLFHQGLMQLYGAQFFPAFHTLKAYIDTTGDIVGPYYHIGQVLDYQFRHTGVDVLSLCAIAQALPGQTKLVMGQQRALLSVLDTYGYPFTQVGGDVLTEEVKETGEYMDTHSLYLTARRNAESSIKRDIEWCTISSAYTDEHMKAFESKPEPSDIEIDFIVAYHLYPYQVDCEKAASWADKRKDPIRRGDLLTYGMAGNMMRAYLGVDRFDDAVRIYERNKDQVSADIRELKASQEHINLYLSAAYAGKREFDKSLEYLERELSITEIHKSWLRTESPKTLSDLVTNGDMLYSLFAVVFLLDEFDEFEKAGRYGEIEKLVERYVSRYKHLPVFNRD